VSKYNNSLFQNEIIKWEFTIFTSQSKIDNIIMNMSQQCILGQGPCSVNIIKQLYNNDYHYAKITIDDFEIIVDNQLENTRTAKSILPNFT